MNGKFADAAAVGNLVIFAPYYANTVGTFQNAPPPPPSPSAPPLPTPTHSVVELPQLYKRHLCGGSPATAGAAWCVQSPGGGGARRWSAELAGVVASG
eukprot:6883391-Prymnesium_polylepis.1